MKGLFSQHMLAETPGFEPWVPHSGHDGFQIRPAQIQGQRDRQFSRICGIMGTQRDKNPISTGGDHCDLIL